MKNTVYLMVMVEVETTFEHISDTVNELENETILSITDTKNIKVLTSEILITRVRKPKN